MDKQQFLEYDNELRTTGTLDNLKLYTIVESYCIEKKVSPQIVDTYLPILMATVARGICLSTALEYYEEKFGICKLIAQDSNGELKVIKIY